MGKPKNPKRVGRKQIDDVGSMRSLQAALDKTLEKQGNKMETWQRDIDRGFQRSKHFKGKAKK